MPSSEKPKLYKDYFDREAVRDLGKQIKGAHSKFDTKEFEKLAMRGLLKLEFHGRVQQIAAALHATLPPAPQSLSILEKSLPPILPDCESPTDGWRQWSLGHFIAAYGIDHYEESMSLMTELTQRFSSEFAVRPFYERYPKRLVKDLLKLCTHKNPHVRRWCSEGIRPRLPWGGNLKALIEDPSPILPILEKLKDDPELYVRRSVANNLNDIAKDHPDLVIKICKQWSENSNPERDYLIKHALRSLLKKGDPQALKILGYKKPAQLNATLKVTPKTVSIGEFVELKASLQNNSSRSQKLMVDYLVHYVRQGGKTGVKVFKWKTLELKKGGTAELSKKHSMKKTSVRALYPGAHQVELQVNGEIQAKNSFKLK